MYKKEEKNFATLISKELMKYEDKSFAAWNTKILNICKGGYGEGDVLLGVRVPQIRNVIRKYWMDIDLKEVSGLLCNKIHEIRFAALMILIAKYKIDDKFKADIVKIYLKNSQYVNNWDLVDLSAPKIVGHYWYSNCLTDFWKYAKSNNIWRERIAIVSTLYFIKQARFKETIILAEMFMNYKHDLIYKAVGWMLREIGKRNINKLILFLDEYSYFMPRTMLRYSIEKLSLKQKKYYLKKKSSD
ncbi:MAG: DNA alkylation repair protein [Endomicrobium sp.]|jgi:3-methyladenine DNA glycosylase AlkD|nr:DNA alkylation repair protein [Endomicrobium sp.]